MKQKIIFSIITLLFSLTSFAQENNKIDIKKDISSKGSVIKVNKFFTDEQLNSLNNLLTKSDYINFYNYIKKTNVSGEQYINYLESKKYEGHIPLYWLMAEYYSKQPNKEEETHIWFNTAIIMTQQDSYLCNDPTAKYAPEKLSRGFPNALTIIRSSPQYNDSAMRQVIFFISNLKTRINPVWVCSFGNSPVIEGRSALIPNNFWAEERSRVFQKFTKNYPR